MVNVWPAGGPFITKTPFPFSSTSTSSPHTNLTHSFPLHSHFVLLPILISYPSPFSFRTPLHSFVLPIASPSSDWVRKYVTVTDRHINTYTDNSVALNIINTTQKLTNKLDATSSISRGSSGPNCCFLNWCVSMGLRACLFVCVHVCTLWLYLRVYVCACVVVCKWLYLSV